MSNKTHLKVIVIAIACPWLSIGHADEVGKFIQASGSINNHPELEKYIPCVHSTNGLTLGVGIIRLTTGTNTTELPIDLIFKAPTNGHCTLYVPKDEYLVRLGLYDSNNCPVAKTDLGSKYGRYFDDLHWDLTLANQPHGHPQMRFIGDTWSSATMLPKTADLFMISKPGQYRLKVEVQILLLYLQEKQVREIVRFPPVDIAVTRPEISQPEPKREGVTH